MLPYPQRLRALLAPLRLYAGTPLQALARRSGLTRLFGPQIAAMERLLPPLPPESFRPSGFPVVVPAQGERRYRVGLVLGCVQRLFDPAVNAAAVRVLSANGIEVVIPPAQDCCGAMTHHQGELAQTRELAGGLIDAFDAVIGPGKAAGAEPLDAVLVAASGCGHTLKAYDRILAGEPRWAAQAGPFARQVADIQEFLDRVGLSEEFQARLQPLRHPDGEPASAERPVRLAYHDACHMLHGQRLQQQPRRLLRRSRMSAARGSGGGRVLRQRRHLQPGAARAGRRAGASQGRRPQRHRRRSGRERQHRLHACRSASTWRGPAADPVLHPIQLLERSATGS